MTAELRTGFAKRAGDVRRERKLEAFVGFFPVRDFDDIAARYYGDIRADLEARGVLIGPLDLLIAAHARSLDAVLVTGNVSEFSRVRGLDVMSVTAGKRRR